MAEKDKSSTHQKVVKGGEYGWIHKDVWAEMVRKNKKNGFEAIISDPPEVEFMKQKNKGDAEVEATVITKKGKKDSAVIDEELTGKE